MPLATQHHPAPSRTILHHPPPSCTIPHHPASFLRYLLALLRTAHVKAIAALAVNAAVVSPATFYCHDLSHKTPQPQACLTAIQILAPNSTSGTLTTTPTLVLTLSPGNQTSPGPFQCIDREQRVRRQDDGTGRECRWGGASLCVQQGPGHTSGVEGVGIWYSFRCGFLGDKGCMITAKFLNRSGVTIP